MHNLNLVLGNFNINALKDLPLFDTMRQSDYTLLRFEPTHIMGAILNHVYIKNNTIFIGKFTLQTHPIYYPDHDAILINLSV